MKYFKQYKNKKYLYVSHYLQEIRLFFLNDSSLYTLYVYINKNKYVLKKLHE